MKPLFVRASAFVAKSHQVVDRYAGRTLLKGLLVGALLMGGPVLPAQAIVITTTGIITSGNETGGLFGLPTALTSLVGATYTLMVSYNNLGPHYFTTGDGSFAQDEETPGVTGYVIATINGRSLTTPIGSSLGSNLIADMFDFDAFNQGFSGASGTSAFVNVSQELTCGDVCVPFANLKTNFQHTLTSNDFGTDLYTFEGAGFPAPGTPVATFMGTQTSFAAIPEPASMLLLTTGLLGLGLGVGRRRG